MINNEIDQKIEDAITTLIDLDYNKCAKKLESLAIDFASCGMTLKSFLDIKTYILESAKKKGGISNLEANLKFAENILTEKRKENDRPKTQKTH